MDIQRFSALDQLLIDATAQLRDGLSKVSAIGRGGGLPSGGLLSLSHGLELLMKVVISLRSYETSNKFPSKKAFRNDYGHSLKKSLDAIDESFSSDTVLGRDFEYLRRDEYSTRLIDILSDFAKGGRYYHLDSLTVASGEAPGDEWRALEMDILRSHPREFGLLGTKRWREAFELIARELIARIERLARVLARLFTLGHLGADGKRLSPHILRFAGIMDQALGTKDYGPAP